MSKTSKTFVWRVVAGAVGGIIGGSLVHSHWQGSAEVSRLLQMPRGMLVAIALICLFSIVWDTAAKNSAPSQFSESAWSRRLHLMVLNGGVLLLVLPVPGLTRRFLPASTIATAAGLSIEVTGILFAFWARDHLGRNWSGEVRIAIGHQLIRSGPYRYVRHPIYTGVLSMYAGAMLVSGEIHALLAMAIITVAYGRKLRLEEQILRVNFGPAWDAYRRDTWSLVPPLF
jgi:protein-S-isoprenylcysteine O-methyltransferase Ste14